MREAARSKARSALRRFASDPRGPRQPEAGEITEVRHRPRALGLPRVVVGLARIRQLPIDPRAAFLLSRIDGQTTVDTLVDITGFEFDELLTSLARLVQLGAVEFVPTDASEPREPRRR